MTIEKLSLTIRGLLSQKDIINLKNAIDTDAQKLSSLLIFDESYDENDLLVRVEQYTHHFSANHKRKNELAVGFIENDDALRLLSERLLIFPFDALESFFPKVVQSNEKWGELIAYGFLYHLEDHAPPDVFNRLVYLNNELNELCRKHNRFFKQVISPDGNTNLNHTKRFFRGVQEIDDSLSQVGKSNVNPWDIPALCDRFYLFPDRKIQDMLVELVKNFPNGEIICQALFKSLEEYSNSDVEFLKNHPQLQHLS